MASNANIYTTGYDVQVIGDFLPHLNCGICTLILRNAMHGCCNHVFCKACITKHIECGIKIDGNVMCPGGCNIVINSAKLEASKFADRMVNTLTTKCSNDGCIWQGDLLDLVQVHQINCNYILQTCINNGCNEKYLKKDILQHNEECLFKLLQCSYCQTDILRMNKEAHDVECLNEQVKCIYYDIGCKMELRRKDIYPHEQTNHAEHTRLIYQNLTNSNGEIKDLKLQNDTMKQEIFTIKQENNTMKQKIVVLEKDNVTMKKDNVTMKKDNVTMKQENDKLKKETFVMKEELLVMKEENAAGVLMKSNEEVKNIDSLKKKLSINMSLCGKVSLSNDDIVLNIKCNNRYHMGMPMKDVSKCYETNDFDWLFHKFSLMDNKSIIMELIINTKYHFYEYKWCGPCYSFVFSLDLNHIKNTEVVVPDMFKITIIDNEIMMEILNQKIVKGNYCLYIENFLINLDNQKKLNLKQLDDFQRVSTPFAKGYAFLRFCKIQYS